MSVASPSLSTAVRSKALMVRLAPYLVEAICELARALKEKTHAQTEISGLLFGKSHEGILTIEALKTFKDSSGPRSELARRERMEKSFEAAMALANEDPEFAAYKLLGWFSLRGGGGLISSDVAFHNQHFKNTEDVSLIVWREGDTQITTEIYAGIEDGKLSTEDYRWSSVRLSTELRHVSQPVDLIMRVRMNDDLYLRTYGVSTGNERKEEWRRIAESAKRTILSLWPGRGSDDANPEELPLLAPTGKTKRTFETRTLFRGADEEDEANLPAFAPLKPPPPPPLPAAPPPPKAATPAPAPPAPAPAANFVPRPVPAQPPYGPTFKSAEPPPAFRSPEPSPALKSAEPLPVLGSFDVNRAARRRTAPEVSGLPMVLPKHKPQTKGTPWLPMAVVFVLCSGLTFAVLALKSVGNGEGKISQIMRVLFPSSELELHAESRGDSLVVSWNRRNPAVSSSTGAVLSVSDGSKHFERKLDPDLVSEGVVSYKPVSGDVTFQLKVFGTDQSIAYGKLRVLDATSPAISESRPALDFSHSSPPPPSEFEPAKRTQPITQGPVITSRNAQPVGTPSVPVSNPPAPPDSSGPSNSENALGPAPSAQTPPETSAQQPQPEQQSAAQQSVPVTSAPTASAPKPAATRPTASYPSPLQTSKTAINGWDPNPTESKSSQTEQESTPPDSKSVDFVGPKVLLQVMPNTRSLTPGVITEVTRVEVEVRIDASGHVQSAHLTNPNVKTQLGLAAVAAAKQWTFQPASLRGAHVPSDHTIVFEFRPEGK